MTATLMNYAARYEYVEHTLLGATPVDCTHSQAAVLRVVLACVDNDYIDDLTTLGWNEDLVSDVVTWAGNARDAHSNDAVPTASQRAAYLTYCHNQLVGALDVLLSQVRAALVVTR